MFDWHNSKQSACIAIPERGARSKPSVSANTARAVPGASLSESESQSSTASRTVRNYAQQIVAMRAAFRTCYRALLARDRQAEGAARLTFTVDCQGMVTAIHAAAHGVDRETVDCMFARVAKSRFPPPEGGWASVQVPVTFVRENATNHN